MGKLKSNLLLFALAFGEEGRAGGAPLPPPPAAGSCRTGGRLRGQVLALDRGSPRSPKLGSSSGFRRFSLAGRNTSRFWQSACKTLRRLFAAQRARRNRASLGLTVTKKWGNDLEIENHRGFQTLILPPWHTPPTPLLPLGKTPSELRPGDRCPGDRECKGLSGLKHDRPFMQIAFSTLVSLIN